MYLSSLLRCQVSDLLQAQVKKPDGSLTYATTLPTEFMEAV